MTIFTTVILLTLTLNNSFLLFKHIAMIYLHIPQEPDHDAIVVSSETIAGGHVINDVRQKKGFQPLAIIVTRRTLMSSLCSRYLRESNS